MNRIIVFTGPVQSGKTTILLHIFKDRQDVSGFLCPDLDGQRYFFDLETKEWLEFEVKDAHDLISTISVGKYFFRSDVFTKAKNIIDHAFHHAASFLVIDEIGKLELKGQGLEPELYTILQKRALANTTLILVVRDYLLQDVLKRYNLLDADVIHIEDKDEILKFLPNK